jgi:hypothetical protein
MSADLENCPRLLFPILGLGLPRAQAGKAENLWPKGALQKLWGCEIAARIVVRPPRVGVCQGNASQVPCAVPKRNISCFHLFYLLVLITPLNYSKRRNCSKREERPASEWRARSLWEMRTNHHVAYQPCDISLCGMAAFT